MKTHKVIDLVYHGSVFSGTYQECLDWKSKQGFGYQLVPMAKDEIEYECKMNFSKTINDNILNNSIINGSGLFNWNSPLTKVTKSDMLKWYNNLSELEKQYIIYFRCEAEFDLRDTL